MMEQNHSKWQNLMERAKKENWGMLPSPPDDRDWPLSKIAMPVALPPSVRMDHLVPHIFDQGRCGTCVGMAGATIKNAFANRKKLLPESGLSPLFLYARCKQEDGIPDQEGTYPRVALKVMQHDGIAPENVLPYSELPQDACLRFPEITQAYLDAAQDFRIKAYARLWTVNETKQALAAGKFVMAGVLVTDSFLQPQNGIIQLPEGRLLGLHAIALCGYDDTKQAFRMVNSWGTAWGEKGFAWLPYAFCEWKSDLGMTALAEAWGVEMEQVKPTAQKIELWINKPIARINGAETMIDPENPKVVPLLIEGRTMLPARFISEAIGKRIDWEEREQKVTIEG